MDLHKKSALITGGGSGIGAAIARALASHGARVAISGRQAARLEQVAREIREQGGQASVRICDLTDASQCQRLAESVVEEFGHVDILVNNAGLLGHGKLLADYSVDEWDAIMDTNVRSAFLVAKVILPGMAARKGGHVINISSVSGIRYYGGESLYGISKHALNALTNFITEEYGPQGIRSVAICPGLTQTDMGLSLRPERHERLLVPEDIAEAVIWILGQRQASKVTGPIVIEPTEDPWDGKWTPTSDSA